MPWGDIGRVGIAVLRNHADRIAGRSALNQAGLIGAGLVDRRKSALAILHNARFVRRAVLKHAAAIVFARLADAGGVVVARLVDGAAIVLRHRRRTKSECDNRYAGKNGLLHSEFPCMRHASTLRELPGSV